MTFDLIILNLKSFTLVTFDLGVITTNLIMLLMFMPFVQVAFYSMTFIQLTMGNDIFCKFCKTLI